MQHGRRHLSVSLLVALLFNMSVKASAGTFDDWSRFCKITFAGYTRNATLTNFPVLVKLGTNIISGFDYEGFASPADGADLRFSASNQIDELKYEIEEWNTNGTSWVWVQVDALSSTNDHIYAYWGKSGEAMPAYTTNGTAWNSGYTGVWHLTEEVAGVGTANVYKDSTTSGFHGTDNITATGTNGVIDGGHEFGAATQDRVDFTRFVLPVGVTHEAWVKTTSSDATAGYSGNAALNVLGDTSSSIFMGFGVHGGKVRYNNAGAGWNALDSSKSVNDGNWHHIAATHESPSGNAVVYVDGVADGSATFAYQTTYSAVNAIGAGYSVAGDPFDGNIDEARVSSGIRSTNWIWATWLNGASNTTFNNYGPDQSSVPAPEIANAMPTNITRTSANLNGYLSSTGGAETTVSVYWGDSNGGAPTSGLWETTNTFAAGEWGAESYPTTNVTLSTSNVFYYYRYYVVNVFGTNWADTSEMFLGGAVWVTAPDPSAAEAGPDAGIITVQRASSATNESTTVNFTIDGTATPVTDYTRSPGGLTVILPAGVAATNFTITPVPDPNGGEGPETVTLVLGTGLYAVGAPTSNTVTIADEVFATGTNRTVSTGDWGYSNNWSLARTPVAGDYAIVEHAILLTNDTPALVGCIVSNATLTFTNWATTLNAEVVTVKSNGVITHAVCDTNALSTGTNRVHIVCSNTVVELHGAVNVDSRGYPGWVNQHGPGPGGGFGGASSYGSGGGHGGQGGDGYYGQAVGGVVNGEANAPVGPGSAGGGSYGASGGNGGGAVSIEADNSVTVLGLVSASGGTAGAYCGGGAGGAVHIACKTFGGSGAVRANGGASSALDAGGGGGGRIAVVYDKPSQALAVLPTVTFSTAGGYGHYEYGDIGTLYFSDLRLMTNETINLAHMGRLVVPVSGGTNWAAQTLTVAASCRIQYPEDFMISVAGDATIGGAGRFEIGPHGRLDVSGNLIVTNGGSLAVHSGPTNATWTEYGALVHVTNDVIVYENSWIYPYCDPTNGGSPLFIMDNLTIDSASTTTGIDADSKGYYGGFKGWSAAHGDGYGPGGGGGGLSKYGAGAGYGGSGGHSYWGSRFGGPAYGSASGPDGPGSGGGGGYYGTHHGGRGGGAIRIQAAGDVTANGLITANGALSAVGTFAGGGSGGGIDIHCDTFRSVHGVVRAAGGGGPSGGGGGGGRVALNYTPGLQSGAPAVVATFSAASGGAGTGAPESELGTLYFPDQQLMDDETISRAHAGRLVIPSFTSWSPANLSIAAGCRLRFPDEFTLAVAGDAVISGGRIEIGPHGLLNVGDSLVLTNGGSLAVYSGPTNATWTEYGALVSVTNDVKIYENSWIYPWSDGTNGGSPLFRMDNLTIASASTSAGIDASTKGYLAGLEIPGHGDGFGLGAGGGGAAHYASGAGYGGRGGDGYLGLDLGGATNGLERGPAGPGSGGGAGYYGHIGGRGGGSVHVEATGTVTVDGLISADGGPAGQGLYGGGGAGGGVFIACRTFSGGANAAIRARGGNGETVSSGDGGGGRIAVWYGESMTAAKRAIVLAGGIPPGIAITNEYDGFTGLLSVTNGTGGYQDPSWEEARPGTIVFIMNGAPKGTLIMVF